MPNYLSNKDLLQEINTSRNSFCEYENEQDTLFDIRLWRDSDTGEITTKKGKTIWNKEVSPLTNAEIKAWCIENEIEAGTVLRVSRDLHVPHNLEAKTSRKRKNSHLAFNPYSHFRLDSDLNPVEILRAFWKGDFETGRYAPHRGKITNTLAKALMLLVNRVAKKPNFAHYSYRDEMESQAITQLVYAALLFEEDTKREGYYPNPFAFYTTVTNNAFVRYLNQEKRQQDIADKVCLSHGVDRAEKMPTLFSLGEPVQKKLPIVRKRRPNKNAGRKLRHFSEADIQDLRTSYRNRESKAKLMKRYKTSWDKITEILQCVERLPAKSANRKRGPEPKPQKV